MAAPYPTTASGDDFSATRRSQQWSSNGEHKEGIAVAIQRRHQAAARTAGEEG